MVSNELTGLVNIALSTGKVPIGLLEFFISLIPKKSCPESANDFRPITLLNVPFKVISKVMVNRLRPIMMKLVGPFQNSFLPGCSTLDNVILTQEIMHSMNRKKGKKGFMIMEIDLQKAYDSLDWGFLESILLACNFPTPLVNLIMFSLKESRISVLWNGEKVAPFEVGRGLRQGDPLAPYLFILAMEVLSWEIQEEVRKGTWAPFKASRGGTGVSHLFFADDLMLFSEASELQIKRIMNCLESFSRCSDLTINLSKSLIYCSPNTCNKVKIRVGEVVKIPITENLGKYLGSRFSRNGCLKTPLGTFLRTRTRSLPIGRPTLLVLRGGGFLRNLLSLPYPFILCRR